jgi:hypothetical protein
MLIIYIDPILYFVITETIMSVGSDTTQSNVLVTIIRNKIIMNMYRITNKPLK